MKDVIYDEFQNKVDEVLVRHASLLDIMSKLSDATSKSNRAVTKTITQCGCVQLKSSHEEAPVDGEVCSICREKIEEELGHLGFYIAALCNTLDLNLYDVLLKEYKKINTLGKYTLY
ncbi:DUF1573 domain-containing protein [Fusibacter sp. JL298sf-3]